MTINEMVRDLPALLGPEAEYPECMADITTDQLDALTEQYLTRLPRAPGRPQRMVDKALNNFEHVGLLHLMFPHARIIHAKRHPQDLCLSCYFQDLPTQWHPYAGNLRDLGQMYRLYDQLMTHWRDACGLPMLEVDYETLVQDQETVSRQIIEFIGLEWDDRCLRFHEAKRAVTTASYGQVQQPMYASAVARYERYAQHLGPLRDALGDVTGG